MDILFKLKLNPENPRIITKKKFVELENSILNDPDYFDLLPIGYDENLVILAGNQRLKALRNIVKKKPDFVVKDSWFVQAVNWDEDKKRRFIIKSNLHDGTWDFDELANKWDLGELKKWGLDVPGTDEFYSRNIVSPVYTPNTIAPAPRELVDTKKADELLKEIDEANIPDQVKVFLRLAAMRHYVFDYSKIADYYAGADKDTQKLMEKSALVIIDFESAIENGYIELTKAISMIRKVDYGQ